MLNTTKTKIIKFKGEKYQLLPIKKTKFSKNLLCCGVCDIEKYAKFSDCFESDSKDLKLCKYGFYLKKIKPC